jgi:hypothetical protein
LSFSSEKPVSSLCFFKCNLCRYAAVMKPDMSSIDAFRAKEGEYEERAAELRAVTVGLDTTFHHVMCA